MYQSNQNKPKAQWTTLVSQNGTSVLISDGGGIRIQAEDGRFIGLAGREFDVLNTVDLNVVAEALVEYASRIETVKVQREINKIQSQIKAKEEYLRKELQALEDQKKIMNQKTGAGLKVV